MNLVDSLRGFFGSETTSGIAQSLSESPSTVQSAVSAAVPTALAALTHLSSRPEGAQSVMNAVRDTDTSLLSRGSDLFTGTQAMSTMESGTKTMSSLFGGSADSVISTISKFSGLPLGSAKSLMGMILPVVLGFVGKSATGAGVSSASGLASFLQGQASSVASAMPLGLKQHLSWIPGISSWAETATAKGEQWAQGAAGAAQHAYTTSQSSPAARYVPLVLLLIALGAIAWYLWPSAADRSAYNKPMVRQTVDQMKDTAQKASAQLNGAAGKWFGDVSSLGDPALGKDLSSTFSDLGTTLSSISDSASVDAAQTKLTDLQTRIDGWGRTLAALSPETQTKVKDLLRSAMPSIQEAQTKALSVPGARDKLGPTLDSIMAKLRSYTGNASGTM